MRRVNSVTLTAVTPAGSVALTGGSPQSLTLSPDGTAPGVTDIKLATIGTTFTSADIVVKVGSLQQTIAVTKAGNALADAAGSTLFPGGNIYTSAEVAGAPSWLTLSTNGTNDVGSSYTQPNASSLTPIYFKTQSNDASGAADRSGEVFLSRATQGRVKAYIGQEAPIPECTMYVGMFGGALVETAPGSDIWQFERPLYVQCADESTSSAWGPNASAPTTNNWDGRANTWNLRATTYPAANKCFAKNSPVPTSVSDPNYIWYLPAQDQLTACWVAHSSFPTANTFNAIFYWSATEIGSYAWSVTFTSGLMSGFNKTSSYRLRCVREISE